MRNLLLYIFISCMVSACVEFSYKQGQGRHELDSARQACRSEDVVNTEKCLEEHGWFIYKFDDQNVTFHAESSDKTDANIGETETPDKPVEAEPNQIYKISSWWKIGANDKMMKMDLEQCGESLGKRHQPNIAEQTYTKALIHCMNKQGWTALGTTN